MTEQKTKPVVNVKEDSLPEKARRAVYSKPDKIEYEVRPSSEPGRFGTKVIRHYKFSNGVEKTRLAGIAKNDKDLAAIMERVKKEDKAK